MKIIKLILGVQACILGLLFIIYMLGEIAFSAMELEMYEDMMDTRPQGTMYIEN
jgi:hypothetical protein